MFLIFHVLFFFVKYFFLSNTFVKHIYASWQWCLINSPSLSDWGKCRKQVRVGPRFEPAIQQTQTWQDVHKHKVFGFPMTLKIQTEQVILILKTRTLHDAKTHNIRQFVQMAGNSIMEIMNTLWTDLKINLGLVETFWRPEPFLNATEINTDLTLAKDG